MDVPTLLSLHKSGLSNRQIGHSMGHHASTIDKHITAHGLKGNRDIRKKLQMLPDGRAACTKCQEPKPLSQFHVQRSNAKWPYRLSYCDACRSKQVRLSTYRSLESFCADRIFRTRHRALKLGIEFDLTLASLLRQYSDQGGLCFYTDVPLDHGHKNHSQRSSSFSLDRVDVTVGYLIRNVVICSSRINTVKHNLTLDEMKRWTPSWYERAAKFLGAPMNDETDPHAPTITVLEAARRSGATSYANLMPITANPFTDQYRRFEWEKGWLTAFLQEQGYVRAERPVIE